ncbi:MAG: UDP-N-acetylmuramoyl-L-alanine--D-glutamate ligase [Candidatus Liptonbacteria bacterium]|nr:UDP-N-acetylmuramoyl-L-alanine--D-glutamate ligase [Candidatus Liptonbacteria bacterium]
MLGKKIAIVGFGAEGRATLKLIRRDPAYRHAEVWVLDRNATLSLPRGIKSILGEQYLDSLADFDVIFRTPGVPFLLPQIQRAMRRGSVVSSVTDLFFQKFRGTIIGVTGTKGKGTTTTLLYRILKRAGKDAHLAGNIGTPAIALLPRLKKTSIAILELSSFQLQGLRHSPRYAVVLGVFPDHQDSHKTMREYVDAKANIAAHQKKSDTIFFVSDNALSRRIAQKSGGKRIPVSPRGWDLFSPHDLVIPGAHNYLNAVVAGTVARHLDIADAIIRSVARSFKGLPYRIQFVREVNGVRMYNDSASTNPQTTIAAVKSFSNPVILIAGGKNKGLDYAPLSEALASSTVKFAVLFGENKDLIGRHIPASVPSVYADTLTDAVAAAMSHASSGDVVVFSPGSASFDMFKNYKDRGAQFDKIVKNL